MRLLLIFGVTCICCLVSSGVTWGGEMKRCHDAKLEAMEPGAAIYALSPFVHGYRDGYQQGFHDADVDAQFSHPEESAENMRNYREVQFQREFGDKPSYAQGFRAGFLGGVKDLRSGLEFRLFSILNAAAPDTHARLVADPKLFNQGVQNGYLGGTEDRRCPATTPNNYNSFCAGRSLGEALRASERERELARR